MVDVNTIKLDIPAHFKHLSVIGAVVTAMLGDSDHAYNIQLAVHEVCTNIIEHAYQHDTEKRLTMRLSLTNQTFSACIDDQGRAFNPNDVEKPDFKDLPVRGLGLFIVYELMDTVDYRTDTHGNHWTLTKYLKDQHHDSYSHR